MQLTATLSLDELTAFANEAFPARIEVSPEHCLYLGKIRQIRFVAGRGAEVELHARIRWPLLGLHIPIEVNSAVVLLEPTFEHIGQEDVLAFRARVESLDVAHAPGFVERPLLHRLNEALTSAAAVMCWRFQSTLDWTFPLSRVIEPRTSISLAAGVGGKIIVTESVLSISVPLLASCTRAPEIVVRPPSQEENASTLHTP